MSYDLTNDSEGSPTPPLPGISARHLRWVIRWGLAALGVTGVGLLLWWLVYFYTNLVWFELLGFEDVFVRTALVKASLFFMGATMALSVLSLNFLQALKLAIGPSSLRVNADALRLMLALTGLAVALILLIASPIFGMAVAGHWETLFLLFNRASFGMTDPAFGRDYSFYVVVLPALNFIQGWLLGLVITAIVSSLALYLAIFGLRGINLIISPRMLKHLAVLGIALMLTLALGHALSIYGLVHSEGGAVYGATYTDVNARAPALGLLIVIALLAAAGMGISASRFFIDRGLRLMAGSFSLWAIMAVLAGVVFPLVFQRVQVSPNEFAREEPFIARNIEATRAAYQLDRISVNLYPADGKLDAAAIRDNQDTLDNIRLWDLGPLRSAYNQLQFMELYYSFLNMDSDRYEVDGRVRQVLISARELHTDNLSDDARNWVNLRLGYTHGYGVAMSPATGFTPGEGRPEFFIKDIPLSGKLPITRPELYYGESPVDFTVVNTSLREVNPDPGYGGYAGSGGIPLGSILRRVAFAIQLGDVNLLLSDRIGPDSRLQYRRQIAHRVGAIAPFLKLDRDPYPALDEQGKLWWIQDAYTTTSRYPYSTPSEDGYNYIRNSVKITIDAYDGTVAFYVIDPDDPLVRMYRRAFPELFQDISAMPTGLREHIRYPVQLFSTQTRVYLRYHVTDPQVFFNEAEQWAIPLETRIAKTGVAVVPSYLQLKLPGETREEFVLLMPFTPAGEKKNLVAWLAARNDWPNYGELLAFQLPTHRQIDGPSQVEARIENDQSVSQQFTLWSGPGSKMLRGQLLVIPIAGTIIYVEPLYLQSEALEFPELKQVILADESNLVMADTINEGIAMLVGAEPEAAAAAEDGPSPGAAPGSAARDPEDGALGQLGEMEEDIQDLRESLQRLQESLDGLREALGGGTP